MVSAAALVLLSPLLLLTGGVVALSYGRPVLFRQRRVGLGGQSFEMVKFRTMTDERDANGSLLSDAERLTRVGRALRATSSEDWPEWWNVLRGDMSLVGPRPLLEAYLSRYSPSQARRHEVRPGITGWAQVNGRNGTTWAARLDMDVWYVDNYSTCVDFKILLRTLTTVISRRGVQAPGDATMPEFEGCQVSSGSCIDGTNSGESVVINN